MSIDISIKQEKLIKKKLDLVFIRDMCTSLGLQFGVPNTAFALDDYTGDNQIGDTTFVLYNPQAIGRGFSLWAEDNQHDCCLRLNNPATDIDTHSFYTSIAYICNEFKAQSFLQDFQTVVALDGIDALIRDVMAWNANYLFSFVEHREPTVFGAKYPVALEQGMVEQLSGLSATEAMNLYATYLHEKQKGDYYYAKATLYADNMDNSTFGSYAITQNVPSIFPLRPSVPFNYGVSSDYPVSTWVVSLVSAENGNYNVAGRVAFDDFVIKAHLEERSRFDASHVIVVLDAREIAEILA